VTQAAGGAAAGADASGADGDGSGAVFGPGLAMAPPVAVQQLAPPAPQVEDPELASMPEDGLQTAGEPVDSAPPDPASESVQPLESNGDGGAAMAGAPPQEVTPGGMQAPPDMPDEMSGPPPPPMPMEGPGPDAAQDQQEGVQELPAIPEGDGSEDAITAMQKVAAVDHVQRMAKGKHNMISQFMKNFARNMRYSVLEDSEGDMPEEERRRMMEEINSQRGGPPPEESAHHEENTLPIEQIAEQMRPRFRSGGMQHEEHTRRHRHRFRMLNQAEAPAPKKRRRHNFQMLNSQGASPTPQDDAAPAAADSAAGPPIEPFPAEGSPPPELSSDANAAPGTTIPLLQLGQPPPLGLAAVPRSTAQRPQSMAGTVTILALIVVGFAAIGET